MARNARIVHEFETVQARIAEGLNYVVLILSTYVDLTSHVAFFRKAIRKNRSSYIFG